MKKIKCKVCGCKDGEKMRDAIKILEQEPILDKYKAESEGKE